MFTFTDKGRLVDALDAYMKTIGKTATANQVESLINSHAKAIKTKNYNYDVKVVEVDKNKYRYDPINSPDFIAFVKFLREDTKLDYILCVGYATAVRGMVKTGDISGSFLTPISTEEQKNETENKIKFYAVTGIAVLGLILLIKLK